jgi:hypothetical protein
MKVCDHCLGGWQNATPTCNAFDTPKQSEFYGKKPPISMGKGLIRKVLAMASAAEIRRVWPEGHEPGKTEANRDCAI